MTPTYPTARARRRETMETVVFYFSILSLNEPLGNKEAGPVGPVQVLQIRLQNKRTSTSAAGERGRSLTGRGEFKKKKTFRLVTMMMIMMTDFLSFLFQVFSLLFSSSFLGVVFLSLRVSPMWWACPAGNEWDCDYGASSWIRVVSYS